MNLANQIETLSNYIKNIIPVTRVYKSTNIEKYEHNTAHVTEEKINTTRTQQNELYNDIKLIVTLYDMNTLSLYQKAGILSSSLMLDIKIPTVDGGYMEIVDINQSPVIKTHTDKVFAVSLIISCITKDYVQQSYNTIEEITIREKE